MDSFTKKEVASITGLASRLVQFYVEEGIVTPEVSEGKGRGSVRRYSRKNLFEFMVLKELNALGLTVSGVMAIMKLLRKGTVPIFDHLEELMTIRAAFLILHHEPDSGKIRTRVIKIGGRPDDKKPVITLGEVEDYPSTLILDLGWMARRVMEQ